MTSLSVLAKKAHKTAREKGWWDRKPLWLVIWTWIKGERSLPEMLALIHSEVSEALDAYRKGDMKAFGKELADVMIRVMDTAEGTGVKIDFEVVDKMRFNATRPYRHGGRKI